jgi:chromosome segregation ATPase
MLVSISDAAKMADVSRETFYRHIDDKKISIIDAGTKRPKVDVSELRRVYGDKLKPLEEVAGKKKTANDSIPPELAAENAILKEKIQMLETFADRERRQLNDQIENLQESLKKEQETLSKVTAMLSDQRSEAEKKASQENQQAQKLADLEKLVKDLAEQQKAKKKGWWIFGK